MKLAVLLLLAILSVNHGNNSLSNMNEEEHQMKPQVFCVLMHTPGVNWKEGVPFREQPGVEEHVKYMSKQLEDGFLLMGGPYLDNSGGMMICKTDDIAKAKEMAEADPTVKSGLLKVEVKQWMVPMSSLKLTP